MSYEITRDCRFGRRGKIVDYPTYMSANYEEQRTCFREVQTYSSNSHYDDSSSINSVLDTALDLLPLISSSADDASSFSSSTDSSDSSSFDGFGGGDFGGGGASSDW